jgi:hypothetical protein
VHPVEDYSNWHPSRTTGSRGTRLQPPPPTTRNVAADQGLDLWSNARLFGLLNLAIADCYISSFEAKYFYNFWRPMTAIRAGDLDCNPRTIADPEWTSFLVAPAYSR